MRTKFVPVISGVCLLVAAFASCQGPNTASSEGELPREATPHSQAVRAIPHARTEPAAPTERLPVEVIDSIGVVAERVRALAGRRFAGLRVDEFRGEVTAYWAGQVPQRVLRYADGNPRGITVTVHAGADYTRQRLSDAAEVLVDSPLGQRLGVSMASVRADGSGIDVSLEGDGPSPTEARKVSDLIDLPANAISFRPNDGLDLL